MLSDKHKFLAAGTVLGMVGSAVSTQAVGTMLDFDPRLGGIIQFQLPKPWSHGAVYHPFQIYSWAAGADVWPDFFITGLTATTFLVGASAICAGFLFRDALAGKFRKKKFGVGAWGTREDAVAAGLIAGEGPAKGHANSPFTFVLGEAFGTTLTVTDDRDVGVFLPKRQGKSRLLSRSLFTWKSSVFCYLAGGTTDIWEFTSGYRATFSDVIMLDLGSPDGYRYNPLSEIRKGTDFEWDDIKLIATRLPSQSAERAKIPFWVTRPTKVIACIIRYVIHMAPPGDRHLGTVLDMATMVPAELAKILKTSPHKNVRDLANQIGTSDPAKTQEVLNAVTDYLSPWESEIIRKVTSESDFSMTDLMAGMPDTPDRPVSLYIRVPDDMGDEWNPIVKVLFGQARKAFLFHENRMPDGRAKVHELAFVLDEFHSIADDKVQGDFAKFPKYGIRVILATQSPHSLEANFGPYQTIMANLMVQVYGGTGDSKTQKVISENAGRTTEVRESRSSSSEFMSPLPKNRGTVHSEQVRQILDSGEVRSFSPDEMIVFPVGSKPFRVKKNLGFTEEYPWLDLIKPPASTVPNKPRNPAAIAGAFV